MILDWAERLAEGDVPTTCDPVVSERALHYSYGLIRNGFLLTLSQPVIDRRARGIDWTTIIWEDIDHIYRDYIAVKQWGHVDELTCKLFLPDSREDIKRLLSDSDEEKYLSLLTLPGSYMVKMVPCSLHRHRVGYISPLYSTVEHKIGALYHTLLNHFERVHPIRLGLGVLLTHNTERRYTSKLELGGVIARHTQLMDFVPSLHEELLQLIPDCHCGSPHPSELAKPIDLTPSMIEEAVSLMGATLGSRALMVMRQSLLSLSEEERQSSPKAAHFIEYTTAWLDRSGYRAFDTIRHRSG
jgi:hypothetical protein